MLPPLADTRAETLARIHDQARIQVQGEDEHRMLYELLDPSRLKDGSLEPNKGLLSLPEPRPGDLFFDIEGDPFAFDDGIEYLFGVLEPAVLDADGKPTFHAFWSRDEDGEVTFEAEKAAFERLMDFFMERLAQDPEHPHLPLRAVRADRPEPADGSPRHPRGRGRPPAAGRRPRRPLSRGPPGRSGRRVESYSIKRLEPLYGFEREIGAARRRLIDRRLRGLAPGRWRRRPRRGDAPGDRALQPRRLSSRPCYCATGWRSDAMSWPRKLGSSSAAARLPPRAKPPEDLAHVEAVALDADGGRPCATRPIERADEQARWLLAQLLSWHRREDKGFWHRYFELMNDLTDEERVAEREPIGELELLGEVGQVKKLDHLPLPVSRAGAWVHEGGRCTILRPAESAWHVVAVDDARADG